jgi:hypothetical protein
MKEHVKSSAEPWGVQLMRKYESGGKSKHSIHILGGASDHFRTNYLANFEMALRRCAIKDFHVDSMDSSTEQFKEATYRCSLTCTNDQAERLHLVIEDLTGFFYDHPRDVYVDRRLTRQFLASFRNRRNSSQISREDSPQRTGSSCRWGKIESA